MNKLIKYTLIFALVIGIASCTDDFEEMNTNPNQPTEVQADLLFPGMLKVPYRGWEYQTGHNLFSNHYANYVANTASYFSSDRYVIPNGWSMPIWNFYYANILPNTIQIQEQYADDPVNQNKIHEAVIWKVHQAQFLVDHYGDIPYFNAGKMEFDLDYDTQKDIYYSFFSELTEAANKLSSDAGMYSYGSRDLLYEGDAMKWKKFANSLRLRYAIRISNVDPAKAKSEGEAALAAGVFASNDDNAALLCDINKGHEMRNISNWNEFRMSKTFYTIFNELSDDIDPRMYAYFIPGRGTGEYAGIENGLPLGALGDANKVYSNIGPFISKDREYMIMNYAEVCFLKAEAALRGWAGAGDAKENYEAGITASFEYCQDQLANHTTNESLSRSVDSKEKPFLDEAYNMLMETGLLTNPTPYIQGGDVAFKESGTMEEQLRQIITQKWIANFPDGGEAWSEFRRTGYPSEIMPPVDPAPGSLAKGEFIQKLPYVDQEYDLNGTNASDGQNNEGQGDGLDVKLWWAAK